MTMTVTKKGSRLVRWFAHFAKTNRARTRWYEVDHRGM